MPIRTTVVGSYPKVADSRADNLPGVIDRWQKKLVGDEALEQELQKAGRRVIAEQEEAGLDLITDGQIRWEDLPHPVARSVQGIQRGALRRFFDNNVYYRRLEPDPGDLKEGEVLREGGGSNGGIRWLKSAVAEEFSFASRIARKPVKAVLPGPLTLVVSTEAKPGQTREALLSLYTGLLRKEVEALERAGAREIQMDEPAWAAGDPLLSQAVEAIQRIFQGVQARRWVAVYFQDPIPLLSTLAKLSAGAPGEASSSRSQSAEVLSLDLVSARERVPDLQAKALDWVKSGVWKGEIALGLVDGRNTKLEAPEDLKRQWELFAEAVPPERLWLSPNCGLEFLPHESALKKLRLLRQAAGRV